MSVNWSSIKNYEEFESLIRTLLLFEDPTIVPLGREGVDAGQDARSKDGHVVFQFKHHHSNSTNQVIKDAKAELKKISKYRQKTHSNYKFWKDVEEWRMITNLSLNPWDDQKWKEQIVPLFKNIGLNAIYCESSHIETFLIKHPEVHKAYFENETRTFLSLPEIQSKFIEDDLFLHRNSLSEFVGRLKALETISHFLSSDKKIALIMGPGGIGKTRFLLEAGYRTMDKFQYQVLWANNENLSNNTNWFDSIVQSKPTLLIVDEPENENVLRILLEQIGYRNSRSNNWKIAICARSQKDPVIRYLESPRITRHVYRITLEPLSDCEAESLTERLIETSSLGPEPKSWKESAAKLIARNFEGFPIWINLAVSILETHKNLSSVPEKAIDLCEHYLQEVYSNQDKYEQDDIRSTLSIISLMESLYRTDSSHLARIQEELSFEDSDRLEIMLSDLVTRRVLVERGAYKRILMLKPDVVRDHLVRQWLLMPNPGGDGENRLSQKAKKILKAIVLRISDKSVTQTDSLILHSIFRLEFVMTFKNEPCLFSNHFFTEISNILPEMSASAKLTAINSIEEVATYAPNGSLRFATDIFESSTTPEKVKGIFKETVITHTKIQQELVDLIYNSLLGADSTDDMKAGIDLLCEIADIEALNKVQNTRRGRQANDSIQRIIEGGAQIRSDYSEIAVEKFNEILEGIVDRSPTVGEGRVLTKLFGTLTSHKTQQYWGEGRIIAIRTVFPLEDERRRSIRTKLVSSIRVKLESSTEVELNLLLWGLVDSFHSDAVRYQNRIKYELSEEYIAAEKEKKQQTQDGVERIEIDHKLPDSILDNHSEIIKRLDVEIIENMQWIANLSDIRVLPIKELRSTRDIWQWHLNHDEDKERLLICENLEQQYLANSSAKEFEFIEKDRYKFNIEEGAEKKAREILESDKDTINLFINRSFEFYGDNMANVIGPIFYYFGKIGYENKELLDFISSEIARNEIDVHSRLAIRAASSVVDSLRAKDLKQANKLIRMLVEQSGSDEISIALIVDLYASPHGYRNSKISDAELKYLRSLEGLFSKNEKHDLYVACISWSVDFEFHNYQELISRNIQNAPSNEINERACHHLISGVYWWAKDLETIHDNFNTWLLDQLFKSPSVLHGQLLDNYEIEGILTKTGKAPLSWLHQTLKSRAEKETSIKGFTAIRGDIEFSSLVVAIENGNNDDEQIIGTIISLFELFKSSGTVGYYLPKIMYSLDRGGVLIPSEYANFTIKNADFVELPAWIDLCSCYEINSVAWRTMSRSLFEISKRFSKNKRSYLYKSMIDEGLQVYSFEPGVVPPKFYIDVENARKYAENEDGQVFLEFWEWYLQRSERKLQIQEEEAKEARGE